MKHTLFLFTAFLSCAISAQHLMPCPAYGKTSNPQMRKLNTLKNRTAVIKPNAKSIRVDSILKPGNDLYRFTDSMYVKVQGWVINWAQGGPETCNCNSSNPADQDVHIMLSTTFPDIGINAMVAEFTPSSRAATGYSINECKALYGHYVEVTGYMLFDWMHIKNATNTAGGHSVILWRRTCWEIHPICNIRIIK